FFQRRVVKISVCIYQENLEILQLFHVIVHAQVGTLIFISFHGSVVIEVTKNTPHLFPLGMPNIKDISS
ncbi:hypothetical protein MXB_866, partial [Myxobolus squamalis]